jgi:hypothetical protein
MKWKSAAEPIAIVLDCYDGRISVDSAATMLRLSPRTLQSILQQIEALRARRSSLSLTVR